jgi:hypothetical protein
VIAGEKDRLLFSNLDKPNEFGTDNAIDLPEPSQGLISFRGDLIIATEPELIALRGWSPEEYGMSMQPLVPDKGTTEGKSLAVLNVQGRPMLFFMHKKKIWAFDGHQCQRIGYEVEGTLSDMTWAEAHNCIGTAWRDQYRLAFPDKNGELIFDAHANRWFWNEGWAINCYCQWDGTADSGQLYIGDAGTDGRLFKVAESGYEAADFRYKTKAFEPAGPDTQVLFRCFRIEAERDSFPLTINFDVDFGAKASQETIPSPPDNPGWNGGEWGGFKWQQVGTDRFAITVPVKGSPIGRRVAVEVSQYDSEAKKIYGISIGYQIVGRESQ